MGDINRKAGASFSVGHMECPTLETFSCIADCVGIEESVKNTYAILCTRQCFVSIWKRTVIRTTRVCMCVFPQAAFISTKSVLVG